MSCGERHEYSISNDNEEEYEFDIEIKLSSLEWKLWKLRVDEDLRNLTKRLLALERNERGELKRNITSMQSYTTASEDGLGPLSTWALLIRTNKAAFLQCIWLTVVVITISTFGIIEFLRASDNMRAEFKPEKKFQTIDYRDSKSDKQYRMPYIYLYFACTIKNESVINDDFDWSYEEINETLTYLLKSQNYFENSASITYLDEDFKISNQDLPIVEAKAFYEEPWVFGDMFFGYFRLQLADPNPLLGSFRYAIVINTKELTRGSTIWVNGFFVSVDREISTLTWHKAIYVPSANAIAYGSKISATIDYDEIVVRKWRKGDVNYFDSTLGWYHEEENNNYSANWEGGEINITFRGNLLIEYWEEYVAYSYYDWISGLGGMLSLASIIFFWGAYYLVVIFGEENRMGILPGISFIFSNLEKIHVIKDKVPVD